MIDTLISRVAFVLLASSSAQAVVAQDINLRIGPAPAKAPANVVSADAKKIHDVIVDAAVPPAVVRNRAAEQREAARIAGANNNKQILFGDLHAHTAYSDDAHLFGLPIMQARHELRPPMSACNYARFVSQLDFLGTTDHGESYLPQLWRDGVEAMRLCDSVGSSGAPDLVGFVGFEWTSIARTVPQHYLHRNVIIRDIVGNGVPKRSIGFYRSAFIEAKESWIAADPEQRKEYERYLDYLAAYRALPACPANLSSAEMSADCYELALSPAELNKKLNEQGVEAIAIPHGTAWGYSAPLDVTWDNNMVGGNLLNDLSPVIEVFSGHGNSEPYRPFRARTFDRLGKPHCPPSTIDHEPACWRAGIIIKERCLSGGESADECNRRELEARQRFVEVNSVAGWMTVPGAKFEDWLDAGQVRDVPLPAMNYRPYVSVQTGLAKSGFANGIRERFIWGFVASSDNHHSRPGNGFKQINRVRTIDGFGGADEKRHGLLMGESAKPEPRSMVIPPNDRSQLQPYAGLEIERNGSFAYTGGLIAVHADKRSRAGIWDAIKRREVYATSGPKMLLWFDLVNGGANGKDRIPMGSHISFDRAPSFRVVVAGSPEQLPGCPEFVVKTLGTAAIQSLADGECYNPSSKRRGLSRIEVVKITPQLTPDEPIEELIHDQWRSFQCNGRSLCTVEFSDDDYTRDATYYVRAYEVAVPTINGGNLRARKDSEGKVVSIQPCYTDSRTAYSDDCLVLVENIAWSSPIFLDRKSK